MTDRCSADTYVSQDCNDQFPPTRGVLLMQGADGRTPWSDALPVAGHTYIRWWCHSTTGDLLDPGTYRLTGGGFVGKRPLRGTRPLAAPPQRRRLRRRRRPTRRAPPARPRSSCLPRRSLFVAILAELANVLGY